MRYAWHPWHEKLVEVRTSERFRGVVRCFLADEGSVGKMLPEWMLDESACAAMRVAHVGCASVAALDALIKLLDEAATVDAPACLSESTAHEAKRAKAEASAAACSDRTASGNSALGVAADGVQTRGRLGPREDASKRTRREGGGGR